MAKYYALVAGLPNLSVDGQKLLFTADEFCQELQEVLTPSDLKLLDLLRMEQTNKAILRSYESGDIEMLPEDYEAPEESVAIGTLDLYHLRSLATSLSRGEQKFNTFGIPPYIVQFFAELYSPKTLEDDALDPATDEETRPNSALILEDRLAQLYYSSASGSSNAFVRAWFDLNKNIRNVLTIYTSRRLGWSAEDYIVGSGAIEQKLLTSKAKDFDLSEELPYIGQLIQIAEESDITKRERLIDLLKWKWLDDQTELLVFDVESVLAYYLRLTIIERWLRLDEKKGEEVFRRIVQGLKYESNVSLQEFKKSRGNYQ